MKLTNLSIKYKYMLFSAMVVIVVSSVITLISIKIVIDYVISTTGENLSNILNHFNSITIEDSKNRCIQFGKMIATDKRTVDLIERSDRTQLYKDYRTLLKIKKIDILMIYKNDRVLVSDIQGGLDLSLFVKSLAHRIDQDREDILVEGSESSGLFIISVTPVIGNNKKITGRIITGIDLSNTRFTDSIKNSFNIEASIFFRDKRINTTIMKNGLRQTGTSLEPQIANAVLNGNRPYSGSTKVMGVTYVSTYMPIRGYNGLPVGIIGLGTLRDDIDKVLAKIIISITLFTFGAVSVLFIISYIYITRMISDPIIQVSKAMMKISRRELDISEINLNRKDQDEISDLNHSLVNMVDAIMDYESKLEYAAFYDSMTDLPNKRMLYKNYSCIKYFQHGEIHCDNSDTGCKCFISEDRLGVVLYLNTGNLKNINDVFGHSTGDLLLIETGRRLKLISQKYDCELFRLGGDEFIICHKKQEKYDYIIKLADEIIRIMQEPFNIRGNVINVSISIGISLCPENGFNINELLKTADIAMNKAREKGGNTYVFYNEYMKIELENKVEMELALKRSILKNEFELYFQPKYSIKNKKIEGFEALIRWKITDGGFISPDIFIPLAEQTGCIIPLGDWIMKKSFEFIKHINSITENHYIISINVSVAQIMQDNFLSGINSMLYEYDIKSEFIEFEITESVLIQSFSIVKEKLSILKDAGFGLALDDFGKGYSSLSYLKMLPLTTVKLDKTFIDDITSPEMVEDIIRIAHRMGLKIVAEGVESREQYELLHRYNCDYIQGYYISIPLPENELLKILKLNNPI